MTLEKTIQIMKNQKQKCRNCLNCKVTVDKHYKSNPRARCTEGHFKVVSKYTRLTHALSSLRHPEFEKRHGLEECADFKAADDYYGLMAGSCH